MSKLDQIKHLKVLYLKLSLKIQDMINMVTIYNLCHSIYIVLSSHAKFVFFAVKTIKYN